MSTESIDWKMRREEQRETEWQLRNRMLRFVEMLLDRWEADKDKFGTLEAITKQAELVSKLGRIATEQDSGTPQATGISEDFLASLLRIQDAEPNASDAHAGSSETEAT